MTEDPRPAGAPTLEDVARAAGVSRATVSRVVNGVRNVDPAIQESVRQAVAATGYTPNRAARSLVTRRADAIALVVSGAGDDSDGESADGAANGSAGGTAAGPAPRDTEATAPGAAADGSEGAAGPDGANSSFTARVFADPFFGRVVAGVVNYLRPRGMYPVLMFAETSRTRDEVVSYLRQGNADGALVVSTHAEDPLPALITDAGLPAVLYARPARPARISYVDLAHQDGARLAAEHLLARGCRMDRHDHGSAGRARGPGPAGGLPRHDGAAGPSVHPHRRGAVHPGERGDGDGAAARRTPRSRRRVRGERPDGGGRVPCPP